MYIKVNIKGQESSYFELVQGENSLGRAKDCDIRIRHLDISRKHLTFSLDNNQLSVVDHNSTNGIQLAQKSLKSETSHVLQPGSSLGLGKNITVEIMNKDGDYSAEPNLNPVDSTIPGLDFTLGEERTVANMNLNSILSSLENKQESDIDSEQPEKVRRRAQFYSKEKELVSSKTPIYYVLSFVVLIVVLITQKNKITSLFGRENTVKVEIAKLKKDPLKAKKVEKTVQVVEDRSVKELNYLLKSSFCQSLTESFFCSAVNQVRPLAANEGFIQINNKTYFILNGHEAGAFFHSNLRYDVSELGMLTAILKKDKKIRVNLQRIQKSNYLINPIDPKKYRESYISILDFTFTDVISSLQAKKIKKITVIIRNAQGNIGYTKEFSADQLNFIKSKQKSLSPFLKFYFISGYLQETERVFKKVKVLNL